MIPFNHKGLTLSWPFDSPLPFPELLDRGQNYFFSTGAVCFSTVNSPSSLVSKHLAGLPCGAACLSCY